jgi:hypothetical protein
MIVDSEQPSITKTHEVYVKQGHMSVWQLEFVNRLNLPTVYEFASSDEKIVSAKHNQLKFEPKEAKMVDLHFMPLAQNGTYKAFIYASDIDDNVMQCFQLNIKCLI